MNKQYRIVWSIARQAYVVASELARVRNRKSRPLAAAVAVALLPALPAVAADVCGGPTTTISTAQAVNDNCELGNGESLTITVGGELIIDNSNPSAILVNTGIAAGAIVNQGSVDGYHPAVNIIGSAIGIDNTGFLASVLSTIQVTGTIDGQIVNGVGGELLSYSSAISLLGHEAVVQQGIVNDGLIDIASSGIEINGNGSGNATVNGGIVNRGTIDVDNYALTMSRGTVTGGLTNSGLFAGYYTAIQMADGSTIQGDVVNETGGVIRGESAALNLDGGTTIDGDVINRGLIEGVDTSWSTAIDLNGWVGTLATISGTLRNETAGVIQGRRALALEGATLGALENDGQMLGEGTAVYVGLDGHIEGDFINRGVIRGANGIAIDGGEAGVVVGVGGDLINSGLIDGIEVDGNGIEIEAYGADAGILGTLWNQVDGEIRGSAMGLSIYSDGNPVAIGGLRNDGVIHGGIIGVSGDGLTIANGLDNAGTIEGDSYAIALGPQSQGMINLIGEHARLIGDVLARDSDVVVKSGATFANENAFHVRAFIVESGAELKLGRGTASSDDANAMIDGIRVSSGFQNRGVVSLAANTGVTITGDYIQDEGGVLRLGVAGDSDYARLNVTGTAMLESNARIDVNVVTPGQVFNATRLYNVLHADTLVSDGTFQVTDNSLLFDFGAEKTGNTVNLTLAAAQRPEPEPEPKPEPEPEPKPEPKPDTPTVEQVVVNTGNNPALGAAQALDRIFAANPTGGVAGHFVGLTTQQQVTDAVTQTLPLLTGGSIAAASSSLSGINRVVQARVEANRGLSSGDDFLADSHVWLKPFGSWADQDHRDGVDGFRANTTGFVLGSDAALNERLRVGAALAYARADVDGKSHVASQSLDVSMYQLIGYGSYSLSANTELNFQLDVGRNNNDGRRSIEFANTVARADYDSDTLHLGAGIGHTLAFNETTSFVPSLRLDYTVIRDDSYREKGAGELGLNVSDRRAEQLLLAADGKFNITVGEHTTLALNLGAAYDAINERGAITAAFAGEPGVGFTTLDMDRSPWSVRSGLGLTHRADNGTEITARYDLEGQSDFLNQTASVKVRWAF